MNKETKVIWLKRVLIFKIIAFFHWLAYQNPIKNRGVIQYLLLILGLAACSVGATTPTATPIPTQTPIPTLTPTAVPTTLNGTIYFDLNLNNTQDQASFRCPDEIAVKAAAKMLKESGVDLFAALHTYLPPNTCNENNIGQLVTVDEPGLANIIVSTTINGQFSQVTSSGEGTYKLILPSSSPGNVNLMVTDPNSGNQQIAMRYLNSTSSGLVAIANGTDVEIRENNAIGLSIGLFTNYYSSSLNITPVLTNYTDLNTTPGKMLDWLGNTSPINNIGNWRNLPWNGIYYGLYDQHQGTDTSMPIGTEILAMIKAKIYNALDHNSNPPNSIFVRQIVDIPGDPNIYFITYGHNSQNKVREGNVPTRGQVIALSGDDDYPNPPTSQHLHLSIWQIPKTDYASLGRDLGDYLNGIGKYAGNGRSVWMRDNRYVARDFCPFDNNLWSLGKIPVFPK